MSRAKLIITYMARMWSVGLRWSTCNWLPITWTQVGTARTHRVSCIAEGPTDDSMVIYLKLI